MFSKSEMEVLVGYLKTLSGYVYLADFFVGLLESGNFGFGYDPTDKTDYTTIELKLRFPDVYYAFVMPETELLLYLSNHGDQEYPIVVWRLQLIALKSEQH